MNNPYIGLRTYEEADAAIFRGRSQSTKDIYELILANEVVVCHAESGEGKSSLINAGLCPLLRDERFFPVKICFTDDDFLDENPDFNKILLKRITDIIQSANNSDSPVISQKESNKSPDLVFAYSAHIDHLSDRLSESLSLNPWWLLRLYTLEAYGAAITPVLIFDQFEEVFTRPKDISWTDSFFRWFGALLTDVCPADIVNDIRTEIGLGAPFPEIPTDKNFKLIISLRTEFMGELDYWGIQRYHIIVLKNSRYCLKPLTNREADEILSLQPDFTPEIRQKIKLAICGNERLLMRSDDLPLISALLLSVMGTAVCADMDNVAGQINRFYSDDDTDIFNNILSQFYENEIGLCHIPAKHLALIESTLVDAKGRRVRIKSDCTAFEEIAFNDKYRDRLIDKRLIKCTQINGAEYIEFTHDVLCRVIMSNRAAKKQTKENASEWLLIAINAIGLVLALFFLDNFFEGIIYNFNSVQPGSFLGIYVGLALRPFRIIYILTTICISAILAKYIFCKNEIPYKQGLLLLAGFAIAGYIPRMDIMFLPVPDISDIFANFSIPTYVCLLGFAAAVFFPRKFTALRFGLLFSALFSTKIFHYGDTDFLAIFFVIILGFTLLYILIENIRYTHNYLIFLPLFALFLYSFVAGTWIISVPLVLFALVFCIVPYIYTKDKAAKSFLVFSSVIFAFIACLAYTYGNNIRTCLACAALTVYPLFAIAIVNRCKIQRTPGEILQYCFSGELMRKYRITIIFACVFAIAASMIAAYCIGLINRDLPMLVSLPLLAFVTAYAFLILIFAFHNKGKNIRPDKYGSLFVAIGFAVVALSVGVLQYYTYSIFVLSLLVLIVALTVFLYLRAVLKDSNIVRNISYSALSVVLLALITYLSVGWNFITNPSYNRVYASEVSIPVLHGNVVAYEHNGRYGLMDSKGVLGHTGFNVIPDITGLSSYQDLLAKDNIRSFIDLIGALRDRVDINKYTNEINEAEVYIRAEILKGTHAEKAFAKLIYTLFIQKKDTEVRILMENLRNGINVYDSSDNEWHTVDFWIVSDLLFERLSYFYEGRLIIDFENGQTVEYI